MNSSKAKENPAEEFKNFLKLFQESLEALVQEEPLENAQKLLKVTKTLRQKFAAVHTDTEFALAFTENSNDITDILSVAGALINQDD